MASTSNAVRMGEDDIDEQTANAKLEASLEETLERLQTVDEEEFQRRLEEMDDDRYLSELHEERELTKEDAEEFLSGILAFGERKRQVQSELRDVSEFDDDEWEDGFAFFERIVGDDEDGPTCLECREPLDPERDEIRVADDGAVVYTNCSTCGEDSLEDRRHFSVMAREDSPPIPDADDVEVVVEDDVDLSLDGEEDG